MKPAGSMKSLAHNTAALLFRQIVILAINLYTIRRLLSGLGIDNFALFNVIVSLVGMGLFLTSALGMIVQRYFSFALGEGGEATAQHAYRGSLLLCIIATFLIAVLVGPAGAWFISAHLAVPPGKLFNAQVLFGLTILSFLVSNFTALYSSIIMAHEDMPVFAIFSVAESILRLGAVLAIGILDQDRLLFYGALLLCISIALLALHRGFCKRRYKECRQDWGNLAVGPLREMIGFAGWTIFGQFTSVARNQAVTILINQAFNPATVAARALSVSIATQVLAFSNNFSAALHPPIIKAYAAQEQDRMCAMITFGSRITFFLVWIATLPVIATMQGILKLWLHEYPHQTTLFTRLALVENAIVAISIPLMTAVRATGKMKIYEISLGILQLLVLLFSWLLIRENFPAYSVYVIAILVNLAMFWVRLKLASDLTKLSQARYLQEALLPVLLVVAVSSILVLLLLLLVPQAAELSLAPSTLATTVAIYLMPLVVVYFLGLNSSERKSLVSVIRARLFKGTPR